MTRTSIALSASALLLAIAMPVSQAHAQQADSAAGKSKAAMYDAAQSISMTGVTIVSIDSVKTDSGVSVNAVIAAGTDSMTAWIAPADFLSSKSVSLAAGDVIDITGSKVTVDGKSSLIASEIKKGEQKLMLRDKATGAPAWP